MNSRTRTDEPTADPLAIRFLGVTVLVVAWMMLGLEMYLGHLLIGGHVVAMILIGVTGWAMFVPVLRRILG